MLLPTRAGPGGSLIRYLESQRGKKNLIFKCVWEILAYPGSSQGVVNVGVPAGGQLTGLGVTRTHAPPFLCVLGTPG